MKRLLVIMSFSILLVSCSKSVDDEALTTLAQSLEKRWEFTSDLLETITEDDLEKATQIELNLLKQYTAEDFKDPNLFILYDDYIRVLKDMQEISQTMNIEDPDMFIQWREKIEIRAKILSDINSEYGIPVNEENIDTLNEVLEDAQVLLVAEEIEKSLQNIHENLSVLIEDESILVQYPVDSVLSADSFIAQKTGFPGTAIEILNVLKDYEFKNVVITSINQDTVAISSYFDKDNLNKIDFSNWEQIDSYDGYKFYSLTSDFYIRPGILNQINSDYYELISKIHKNSNNNFWKKHGFTQY